MRRAAESIRQAEDRQPAVVPEFCLGEKENKMAEIIKFKSSETASHIRHDLRELPPGKSYGNESVDPSLSGKNYSLIEGRCQNFREANAYRKAIEKEIFHYKRKDLVHAVEIVVQCPTDCPEEQKEAFFQETYNYICSTLPMGDRCVFVAQVHVDERHFSPTGEMISKDHLHVMYVPAVKDRKHDGFDYKLCADQLTKKARLREFHPGLQKHLDKAGIDATVYRKKKGDGKAVSLSVDQLKELTEKTGITIDHSLTIDELSSIIRSNIHKDRQLTELKTELDETKEKLSLSQSREQELESKLRSYEASRTTSTWGHEPGWGTSSGWGRSQKTKTEEITYD